MYPLWKQVIAPVIEAAVHGLSPEHHAKGLLAWQHYTKVIYLFAALRMLHTLHNASCSLGSGVVSLLWKPKGSPPTAARGAPSELRPRRWHQKG